MGSGKLVNQDTLVANKYPRTVRPWINPGYNQFSGRPFQVSLIEKLTLFLHERIEFVFNPCCSQQLMFRALTYDYWYKPRLWWISQCLKAIIIIIMIFYCWVMVHITDTRAQKVYSSTSAHITETVSAHDQHWEEQSSLSSPQLYRHSQKHRKWITIQ